MESQKWHAVISTHMLLAKASHVDQPKARADKYATCDQAMANMWIHGGMKNWKQSSHMQQLVSSLGMTPGADICLQ